MEFMNNSGYAVARASSFCKTFASDIVVVHDEIDLPHGTLRLKKGGGHGGHNGLRSIISELGSNDFLRVRIGVGKPTSPQEGTVANYVLNDFDSSQSPTVDEMVKEATQSVQSIFEQGIDKAMNLFN
jgi:PTH1 family peptidyl-tRNA hydrolase